MPRLSQTPVQRQLSLPDSAAALCLAPDGRRVAVATLAGDVLILNTSSGKLTATGAVHKGGALAVAWHPHGDVLATAGQDGRVCLVHPSTPPTYRSFGRGWVEHLAWSSDGTRLAIAAGKAIHVVGHNGEPLAKHELKNTVAALAWLPGSAMLVVASYGGLWFYDLERGKSAVTFPSQGALLSLAPSPDGTVIAAGRQDDALELWRWPSGKPAEVSGYAGKVRQLAWHKDGSLLAAAGGELITLWSLAEGMPVGKEPRVLEGHRQSITGLAFGQDNLMVAIDEGGDLITWSNREGAWSATGGFNWKAPLIGLCIANDAAVVASRDATLLVIALREAP
jgi:WD40 repeat protein